MATNVDLRKTTFSASPGSVGRLPPEQTSVPTYVKFLPNPFSSLIRGDAPHLVVGPSLSLDPMTWNSLSADLRDPTCSDESFRFIENILVR